MVSNLAFMTLCELPVSILSFIFLTHLTIPLDIVTTLSPFPSGIQYSCPWSNLHTLILKRLPFDRSQLLVTSHPNCRFMACCQPIEEFASFLLQRWLLAGANMDQAWLVCPPLISKLEGAGVLAWEPIFPKESGIWEAACGR